MSVSTLEERGSWQVSRYENNPFGSGEILRHGLDGRVMLMGLPRNSGWRAISAVCLPHQTYVEKVTEWFDEEPRLPREVAVLEVDTGEWVTVWESDR